MRLAFALNEASPLYKLGGLGDVGEGLTKALFDLGLDVRLILPFHPEIKPLDAHHLFSHRVHYDGESHSYDVLLTYLPGSAIPVYLINQEKYLHHPSDDFDGDVDKSVVFSLCLADFLQHFEPFRPDLLHLHDWHVGLAPLFLKHLHHSTLPTLLTIHNHRYTGSTGMTILQKIPLPEQSCQILTHDSLDGQINCLAEGIAHASAISTVSQTYRQELLEEKSPLGDLLRSRHERFFAITNGIDNETWNPPTDPCLTQPYDAASAKSGKQVNKQALALRFKLDQSPETPLLAFIGRLDPNQKGLGLIASLLEEGFLPPENSQFILLGTGDPSWEQRFHTIANNHPRVRLITRYDEALAHQIYAAADCLLIPSSYEPCGLVQLLAMRYGALPIAHSVGGLKDTIADNKTGILYQPNTLSSLKAAISRGLDRLSAARNPASTYYQTLMSQDFSWNKPAQEYRIIYQTIISADIHA